MNMGFEQTDQVLEEQRTRNREVDAQIEQLQRMLPGRTRECERLDRELVDLEKKRNEATRLAREVRRLREEGGRDEMEDLGRWYRSSEVVLKGLLGVEV
jgi:predicted RNase H-like nuclease (RuvC/YqgF family)